MLKKKLDTPLWTCWGTLNFVIRANVENYRGVEFLLQTKIRQNITLICFVTLALATEETHKKC